MSTVAFRAQKRVLALLMLECQLPDMGSGNICLFGIDLLWNLLSILSDFVVHLTQGTIIWEEEPQLRK